MPAGVYTTYKKDKSEYYRVSITYKGKHISLGSFDDISTASSVYVEAGKILSNTSAHFIDTENFVSSYSSHKLNINFEKYITLINFRDNNIYIKNPIYLCRKYFLYFIDPETILKFNTDDLFYYSTHKIMTRGGYYFVNDYGIQTSILSRYGIHSHSVKGRDFLFRNGDEHDFRYENIYVINKYHGVRQIEKKGRTIYRAEIHINGNYIIGDYDSEISAAIAYNKTVDLLSQKKTGLQKNYSKNYIENANSIEYASRYNKIKISKKLLNYIEQFTAVQ
ncbi:MAG: hypothetical protein ACLRLD_01210 [Lachnospira sp.]